MKKNFLQDVVPSNRRSIRDIPLPTHKEVGSVSDVKPRRRKVEPEHQTEEEFYQAPVRESYEAPEETPSQEEREYNPPTRSSRRKKSGFMKKSIIAVFAVIILVVLIFASRTRAEILLTPKKTTTEVSVTIPTESNPLVTKTQLSKTVSKTLPATGEQQVEKQASGKIKIINKHKEAPQELVKNTRFQTANGLIYRIRDSIVVPGYTMNGATLIPGTLEVEVFADSAGEDYNTSGTVTFTIPGFEGKEQFEKITAESVTNMTGGYIGIQKVVTDEAKEQAEKDLKNELSSYFNQNQNDSTEYVVVSDINTLSFGDIQDKPEGNSVVLSLTGRVDAYSFVKKDLENFIGQNSITGASTTDMFSLDTGTLKFSVNEGEISITGTSLITYITDIEQMKKDFAGKKRSESSSIIDSYNSIERAQAKLKPFWKSKFPSEAEKINVIIE